MLSLGPILALVLMIASISLSDGFSNIRYHRTSGVRIASTIVPRSGSDNRVGALPPTSATTQEERTEPHAISPAISSWIKKDAWWEKIFIFVLSWGLATVSTEQAKAMKHVWPGMGFDQFVKVTRTLLRGTTDDIKYRVLGLLLTLMPRPVRNAISGFSIRRPRWISEKSSQFMSFGLLGWLVGPSERFVVDVKVPVTTGNTTTDVLEYTTEQWRSGVKLTECRYLVESGCKSACLHLCKGPTQSFFNDHLGMKMTMKPNFQDCSCEMFFGVTPPPKEEDDAYGEPCFSTCSMTDLLASQRLEGKRASTVKNVGIVNATSDKFQKCS